MRSKIREQVRKPLRKVLGMAEVDRPLTGIVNDLVRERIEGSVWQYVRTPVWKQAGGRRRIIFPLFEITSSPEISLTEIASSPEISLAEIAHRRFESVQE